MRPMGFGKFARYSLMPARKDGGWKRAPSAPRHIIKMRASPFLFILNTTPFLACSSPIRCRLRLRSIASRHHHHLCRGTLNEPGNLLVLLSTFLTRCVSLLYSLVVHGSLVGFIYIYIYIIYMYTRISNISFSDTRSEPTTQLSYYFG